VPVEVPSWDRDDLARAAEGNPGALERIMPVVQDRVRQLAAEMLAGDRAARWVQASSLVQQALLRLLDQRQVDFADSARVTAVLATIMRRVVVDIARRETAAKRGGGAPRVSLASWNGAVAPDHLDALAFEDALATLARIDAEAAHVAELRLWGGMELVHIAAATALPPSRVRSLWNRAKAWLARELAGREAAP
jgi:RNA polymerase sigma factor (TIGR02999 family)